MRLPKGELVAVFFVVMIATSLVAMPALANGPSATTENERSAGFAAQSEYALGSNSGGPPGKNGGGPPGHDRGDGTVTVPELEENTTVESILVATERLGELDIENDTAAAVAANDSVAEINASLQEYRRLRYADSRAAFQHLAETQRSLAELKAVVDGEDEAIVDDISEELYAASNGSARLAVSDARMVVAANEDDFRNPGQRQKAESALGNAVGALERADKTVSSDSAGKGKPKGKFGANGADRTIGPADRAKALTHLETAWKHSERVLDTTEANTDPALSLTQGQAFERNGTIVVQLEATVTDIRPYAYDEATVRVDGENTTESLSFVSDGSAGSVANGMAFVDVGPEAENVTVTVTATAAHDGDRTVEASHEIRVPEDDIVWDRPDPDEHRNVEVSDESSGVSVAASGDGLHETDVSVSDETPATDTDYRAGPMVRIENATPIDEATVEIPIDEDTLENGTENLSVVTWDPTSDEPWTAVETEIDRDAGVATADVDHFSFFSVFWIDEWEDQTSDTITLDGNRTDGVDDGATPQLIDVMFVVDESGSMGGSRIGNAREASKRFVGALTDDEQAGLVGYAYGGDLKHELTRDHESLNESIDRINAGGSTNTGAGLQEAISEFERNGWENRSQTIILLSDGHTNRGPNPIGIAETAAERDIEISTIGVGNGIDENELREIADITGGDFHHVEDDDDLPETFERVAENQTEVQLQDTNGDGIPDRVAEMDLGMPTGGPGVVGEPLNLDPVALDTSGDGVLDNETVDIEYRVFQEDNETKLYASVTDAKHHPARVDTTGDGVTDREQLEGWEIEVVDDPSAAQSLEELVTDPDVDGDPVTYFNSRTVSADPLLTDSDGDGLTDGEERSLGTDPERTDTTGDGISDAEAFDDPEEDPTVFSTSPPEATLLDYDQWSEVGSVDVELSWSPVEVEAPSWNFQYQFKLEDPAGISSYELKRGSRTVAADDDVGGYTTVVRIETLDSLSEGTFTALRGSQTTLEATDVYGNSGGERIHGQSSLYGDVIGTNVDPYGGGVLSGFTHSAAELPELVVVIGSALWDDPVAAGENFKELVLGIDQETLKQALPMIIESTKETQRLDNPHTKGSAEYEAYAQGWYEGYALHFLASTAYGGTITKGASKSSTVTQRVNRVADDVPPPRAVSAKSSGLKSARIGSRLADEGYDSLAQQFRTAGKEATAVKRVSNVDTRILDELSAAQREQLTTHLARSSDDAVRTTNRLEANDVRKLLGVTDDVPSSKVSDFLSHPRNHRLVSDLDGRNLRHAVDNLPRAEQRALHRLAYQGDRLRNVDPDLSANDVAKASRNGADLRNTQVVGKSPAQGGSVRWMERSDIQHAFNRHVRGDKIAKRDQTTLFPAGQSVDSPAGSATMPSRMPADDAALRTEIEDIAYDTIKRSDSDNGQTIISNQISRDGIESVSINVKSGQVKSVYPRTGEAVRKFEDGQWWRWDPQANRFVSWNP